MVVGQGDHKSPVEQWTTAVEKHQSRSLPMTHGPTSNDRKLDGERSFLKMGQKKKHLNLSWNYGRGKGSQEKYGNIT